MDINKQSRLILLREFCTLKPKDQPASHQEEECEITKTKDLHDCSAEQASLN